MPPMCAERLYEGFVDHKCSCGCVRVWSVTDTRGGDDVVRGEWRAPRSH